MFRPRLGTQLFFIGVVCSLVSLFLSNAIGYLRARDELVDAALRDVRHVAALEAARAGAFVQERVQLVASMAADNYRLLALSSSLQAGADDTARRALDAHLAAKAEGIGELDALVAVGIDGRVVGATGMTAIEGSGPCATWRGERAALIEIAPGRDAAVLWVGAPIRDGEGARIGALCGRHRFDLQRRLQEALQVESLEHGALEVVDDAGALLARAGEEGVAGHGGPPPRAPWAGRLERGSAPPLLAAFSPLPGLKWGLWVSLPMDRALAGLERLKWQAFTLTGVMAVGLMLLIGWASRAFGRRMRRLSETASRLASGHLGERVPESGPREVAELAQAFNHMSAALRDAHAGLEERIEQRTLALRRSQGLTELLLESMERWVIVVAPDMRIVKANAAARHLFGDDLVGRSSPQVLFGRDEPPEACPVRATFETGRPQMVEISLKIGGEQEVVDLETWPLPGPDGAVDAVAQIGHVVTSRLEAQAQMVHNEKMAAFGLLAAGVAHEIGNPLAAIKSRLRTKRDDADHTRETFEIVEHEVDRMGRLLRELIDFARRRRDRVTVLSVNQSVQDVARLLGHDPRARRVSIETHLAAGLPGVTGREDDLVQVLFNLGVNALDAMDGGALAFETAAGDDGAVIVRVRDTGRGIPEDVRARVFEPFFTTKAPGRGTGLGLFVSRSIVERLGGELRLERSGPEGTTFEILFRETRS